MTPRDNGSDRNGGDALAAPGEASQSGGVANRPYPLSAQLTDALERMVRTQMTRFPNHWSEADRWVMAMKDLFGADPALVNHAPAGHGPSGFDRGERKE